MIATMEMARLVPDLYQTLTERFATFLRVELRGLAKRAAEVGHPVLKQLKLDALCETVIALMAHQGGPAGTLLSRERLVVLVDHVLMVPLLGARTFDQALSTRGSGPDHGCSH